MEEKELTSEKIIRDSLLDFALVNKNKKMFDDLTSEYWYLYIIQYSEDDYDGETD